MAVERVGPSWPTSTGWARFSMPRSAGQPPFVTGSVMWTLIAIREEAPLPPSTLVPEVDTDLEAICLRCLAKKPGDRYASACALAAALSNYLEGDRAPRGSSLVPLVVVSALSILALGSAGIYALRTPPAGRRDGREGWAAPAASRSARGRRNSDCR